MLRVWVPKVSGDSEWYVLNKMKVRSSNIDVKPQFTIFDLAPLHDIKASTTN